MSLWLSDPKTGKPSQSTTYSAIAFGAAIIKFLIGGVTIGATAFAQPDAYVLMALLVPCLGYRWGNKFVHKKYPMQGTQENSPDEKE